MATTALDRAQRATRERFCSNLTVEVCCELALCTTEEFRSKALNEFVHNSRIPRNFAKLGRQLFGREEFAPALRQVFVAYFKDLAQSRCFGGTSSTIFRKLDFSVSRPSATCAKTMPLNTGGTISQNEGEFDFDFVAFH
jgi:hypothetical protein